MANINQIEVDNVVYDIQSMSDNEITVLETELGITPGSSSSLFDIINAVLNKDRFMPGEVKLWAGGGSNLPPGWLFCFGQEVSRTDYAALFAQLGTFFGDGDGSTTFNLPDLRDRFPMSAGLSYARGVKGGSSTVTLTTNQIPSHSHTVHWENYKRTANTSGSNTVGLIDPSKTGGTGSTDSAGGGAAHENKPPFLTIYFIIYTGVEKRR